MVEINTAGKWYYWQPWERGYERFNFLFVNLSYKFLIFLWITFETQIHSYVSQFKASVEKKTEVDSEKPSLLLKKVKNLQTVSVDMLTCL